MAGSRGRQANLQPLSRLLRPLPARRGAAEIGTSPSRRSVRRLAGGRSAKRIRGSVSDSVTLERSDIHARLSAIDSRPRAPYDHARSIVADG